MFSLEFLTFFPSKSSLSNRIDTWVFCLCIWELSFSIVIMIKQWLRNLLLVYIRVGEDEYNGGSCNDYVSNE